MPYAKNGQHRKPDYHYWSKKTTYRCCAKLLKKKEHSQNNQHDINNIFLDITESRNYLELSKKENLNMGIIELLNRGIIPDSKSVTRPNQ